MSHADYEKFERTRQDLTQISLGFNFGPIHLLLSLSRNEGGHNL